MFVIEKGGGGEKEGKKKTLKKICLTAARGPFAVIKWNTRLEYPRSSSSSFSSFPSVLPLFLPPSPSTPPSPVSCLSHPRPRESLEPLFVPRRFAAPRLPAFPGERGRRKGGRTKKNKNNKAAGYETYEEDERMKIMIGGGERVDRLENE